MNATVQRWGNSLALRIPSSLAKSVDLRQGSVVEVDVVEGNVIVKPQRHRKLSLARMLRGVTKANRHGERSWGHAVGKEVW